MANGKITGTLIYNEGWESGPLAGPGYFMALKFSSEDWDNYDSIKVGLDPSIETGLVEVKNDPDKNGVFKISDRATQKFIVQTTVGTTVKRTQYDLSDLTYQEPAVEGMLVAADPTVSIYDGTVATYQTDVAIAAGENPGEFDVTGSILYDSETGSPSKFHMLFQSKDHVQAFDSYTVKASMGGMVEDLVSGSTQLANPYYWGVDNNWVFVVNFKPGITTLMGQNLDDIWVEVTLDGVTEKYSFLDAVFVPPSE